ncbi:MAG: DUF502 domain-containing protein [Candidatus Omnitrophica bacterium]|nr:DUF502 domain-containing protein [Candidatus Omnitrophota bacterium]
MNEKTKSQKPSFVIRLRNAIRRRLLAGLLVVVPLWLTYVALRFFFKALDSFFAPLVRRWFDVSIPGLGFVLLIVFIYLIGMITANIIGRSLIGFGESILNRIPLVKNIYQGTKQLISIISLSKTLGFKRVILVEYPRSKLFAVGFVTNTITDKANQNKFVSVFIPTVPNPTSGVFELVPERDVIETNLTIEDGIKMVISGGMITPENFRTRLAGPIPPA